MGTVRETTGTIRPPCPPAAARVTPTCRGRSRHAQSPPSPAPTSRTSPSASTLGRATTPSG
eukprot:7377874-Prymnesium_polylepis.1